MADGANRQLEIRLHGAAARFIDRERVKEMIHDQLDRMIPREVSSDELASAVAASSRCFIVRLELDADVSGDGNVIQLTSVLRVLKPRTVPLGSPELSYGESEVYESPLSHYLGTTFFGRDPVMSGVLTTVGYSLDRLREALVASSGSGTEAIPPQGAPEPRTTFEEERASSQDPVCERLARQLIGREDLLALMQARGVKVVVEEPGEDPVLSSWLRSQGMSSEILTAWAGNALAKAKIPTVVDPLTDRALPYIFSCLLNVNCVDLSQTPLGTGELVGVSGKISVREVVALDENGEHVLQLVGVLRTPIQMRWEHHPRGRDAGALRSMVMGVLLGCVNAAVRPASPVPDAGRPSLPEGGVEQREEAGARLDRGERRGQRGLARRRGRGGRGGGGP